jgi:hypothetical protein
MGKMSKDKNFFQRAVDAIVEGRTRQAERFVAKFEREQCDRLNNFKGR